MRDKFTMKLRRSIRFFFQRFFRGWDDSETWNLDSSFAKLIVPRLCRFQEVKRCHPMGLSIEQWDQILDEMIWTFEFYGSERKYLCIDQAEWDRAQKGLDLFAKFYADLWW